MLSRSARSMPVFRVPRTQIPDDVLEYLLWHEVVHHLLLGQGGTTPSFRRLEAIWPDSEQHDHFLDALHERYDLTSARTAVGSSGIAGS